MNKPRSWSWLLLFTTSGTLLCCAMPITLVGTGGDRRNHGVVCAVADYLKPI